MKKFADMLWRNIWHYDLEAHLALTALALGVWIFIWCPLSSGSPSVRGLHLLDDVFVWLPWKSDYTWSPLLAIPSAFQLWQIVHMRMRHRVACAMSNAMTFSFIAILLMLDNFGTTGVPMYSAVTLGNCVVVAQLIKRRAGLHVA